MWTWPRSGRACGVLKTFRQKFTTKVDVFKLMVHRIGSGFCLKAGFSVIAVKYSGFATNTELFISPSGISELDCATVKTDTAERSISRGRESLQVFFVLGTLAYFQVPPLGGSREEK